MRGLVIAFIAMSALVAYTAIGLESAHAQAQSIQQSGAVSAGHAPYWVFNGVEGDAGNSNVSNLTTLGVTGTGTPFCVSDTKVRTAVYHKLCLGLDSSGNATLSIDGFGGGTGTLSFIIDGASYPFPQIIPPPPIAATPLRSVSSGTSDTVTGSDANGTVAWNSSVALAKTEAIPQCTTSINGFTVTIKDEISTAGTYPITVTTASTIDQAAAYIMAFNHQSATFQCNGATSNWVVK